MNIFVDTGAFYALADKSDYHHSRAKAYFVENYQPGLFLTSDFVLIESWTLIHHKLGKKAAQIFWKTIRDGIISLKYITPMDLEQAWIIYNKYADQDFSLVDCSSFAIIERLRLLHAFTFDSHFYIFRTNNNQVLHCSPD